VSEPWPNNPRPEGTVAGYSAPIPRELWEDKEVLRVYIEKMFLGSLDENIRNAGHVREGEWKQDFAGYFRLVEDTDEDGKERLYELPVVDPDTEDWDHVRLRAHCRTLRSDIYLNKTMQDGEWHDL